MQPTTSRSELLGYAVCALNSEEKREKRKGSLSREGRRGEGKLNRKE